MTFRDLGCGGDCATRETGVCDKLTAGGKCATVLNGDFYEDKSNEELLDISAADRCSICHKQCEKNLDPINPQCDGRWCDTALDYWLEEEYKEDRKDG